RLLENARGVEQVGTIADRARRVQRVAQRDIVDEAVDQVGAAVDQESNAVSHGRRAEQRYDQVRSASDAPIAQRLAEILGPLGQAHIGRKIEKPGDPESRVENDTANVLPSLLELALQQI